MDLPPLPEGAMFYEPKQLAAWLQVSTQCIRNWVRSGDLEHHRFGDLIRVSPAQLRAFVEKSQKKGSPL